ncbi:MAG: hypothetical protein OXG15_10905 [Gammaproteobacteria bacterium]|nr:hypothetical protein [Gammaproteobacteria bacterium]
MTWKCGTMAELREAVTEAVGKPVELDAEETYEGRRRELEEEFRGSYSDLCDMAGKPEARDPEIVGLMNMVIERYKQLWSMSRQLPERPTVKAMQKLEAIEGRAFGADIARMQIHEFITKDEILEAIGEAYGETGETIKAIVAAFRAGETKAQIGRDTGIYAQKIGRILKSTDFAEKHASFDRVNEAEQINALFRNYIPQYIFDADPDAVDRIRLKKIRGQMWHRIEQLKERLAELTERLDYYAPKLNGEKVSWETTMEQGADGLSRETCELGMDVEAYVQNLAATEPKLSAMLKEIPWWPQSTADVGVLNFHLDRAEGGLLNLGVAADYLFDLMDYELNAGNSGQNARKRDADIPGTEPPTENG